ncbi:hypothetical protein DFP85_10697 [Halomonas ventosae]|uniref:Uncharacterized protein n=1 Tax=Halomonas ventosae TaxID=229007 RepID=A0A4R6ZRB8_9GAMM|nr:hypothetical protein [Halomonas ventosae]TDR54952.1 hypothetical protein DFP85_10697 [Halomonas ventosae]
MSGTLGPALALGESTSRSIDGFFGTTDALTMNTDCYLRLEIYFRRHIDRVTL